MTSSFQRLDLSLAMIDAYGGNDRRIRISRNGRRLRLWAASSPFLREDAVERKVPRDSVSLATSSVRGSIIAVQPKGVASRTSSVEDVPQATTR
jgi:hypothetical protein